jgi:tripeptide aminopeptidase
MSLSSYTVAERLMRYVQIDTTADPNSETTPSSMKQKKLSEMLANELKAFGIVEAHSDEWGYVYATIPSNTDKQVPVICFCSHVDTAPDCSGTDVKPMLHKNWNGEDIVLPDDNTVIISKYEHPYLLERIGDDIITASGKTLLGADDKAGIAIIMNLAEYLMSTPEVKHGTIKILFTPDEEIGRGVDKVDMEKLGADYGYTLDGGERGTLEGENFSADGCTVTFYGISAHPGYAKGKMVNAQKVLAQFISNLPGNHLCPETTDGYQGFVHPVHIEGGLEKATAQFIIRDFETAKLAHHEELLANLADEATKLFPGSRFEIQIKEQYRNMKEALDQHPHVMNHAVEAYKRAGLNPEITNIRGGTDGARLSFLGLPCPNIFTGEMAIHSKQEYVSVQDMQKAVDVCVELVNIWATSD